MSEIEVEILTEEDLKQELKELIQSKIVGLRLTPNSGVGLLQIKAASHSFRESQFLTPEPVYLISAMKVFDVIREASDPPITEAEFNIMSDGLKS